MPRMTNFPKNTVHEFHKTYNHPNHIWQNALPANIRKLFFFMKYNVTELQVCMEFMYRRLITFLTISGIFFQGPMVVEYSVDKDATRFSNPSYERFNNDTTTD